jgi:hypothetical protein
MVERSYHIRTDNKTHLLCVIRNLFELEAFVLLNAVVKISPPANSRPLELSTKGLTAIATDLPTKYIKLSP